MGTQQILLIVLSVIIVGAAIAVGIQMFNNQAYSSNKSAIAAEAQTYATQVVQYYKTPVSQGGLGGTLTTALAVHQYLGWVGSGDGGTVVATHESESGTFRITTVDATNNKVVITGYGNSERGGNVAKVETTVEFPAGEITAVLTDVAAASAKFVD